MFRLSGCICHVADLNQLIGVVTVVKIRRRTGTARIFPFCLRRQTIRAALFSAEPFTKGDCVVPRHIDNRVIVRLGEARVFPAVLRVGTFEFAFGRVPAVTSFTVCLLYTSPSPRDRG